MADKVRLIDANALLEEIEEEIEAEKSFDNYDKGVTAGLRIALRDIKKQPTIEVEPVTWYTADENQPDSVGDDVLIVDHDNKYHVAYYCSKGNWIDTNTGNPIEVVKWRYLDGDSDDQT